MRYNRSSIMKNAWKACKTTGEDFADSLRRAWRNAKAILRAKELAAVTETTHTWYAWKLLGYEVIHESKALFQVVVEDVKTKSGFRTLSYFGASQVTDQPQDVAA